MTTLVKINGVYDRRTIIALKELNIKHIGFDFRPTSFNFIQLYKLLEILTDEISHFEKVYLSFQNEKDFIIQKIIDDMIEFGISKDQIVLEFFDEQSQNFYQSFNTNYIVHIKDSIRTLKSCEFLRGICLSGTFLEDTLQNNGLHSYVNQLTTGYCDLFQNKNFFIHLDMNWDKEIYSSYFEFLPIKLFNFSINPLVEVCYRNVNLSKLGPFIEKLPVEM